MHKIPLYIAKLSLCLLFYSVISELQAQPPDSLSNRKSITAIQVNYHWGGVLIHSPQIANMASLVQSYEITLNRIPQGSKLWQNVYRRPRWGVSFMYHHYQNVETWGYSAGILPHIEFNLLNHSWQTKRTIANQKLTFRTGTGIGIFSKPFNYQNNYANRVIGSSITAAMQLGLVYRIKPTRYFEAQTGVALTHYSNGNISEPNWGVNILSFFAGMSYSFGQDSSIWKKAPLRPKPKPQGYFEAYIASGTKEADFKRKNTRASFWVGSFAYGVKAGYRSKFGIGFDFMYDPTAFNKALTLQDTISDNTPFIKKWDIGAKIGHELSIGKIDFVSYIGAYLRKADVIKLPVYARIGLKYNIIPQLFIGVFLKTHLTVADYIEFTLGFNIPTSKPANKIQNEP